MAIVITHTPKNLLESDNMRHEITVDIDPILHEKIEKSPFELDDLIDLANILTIEINSINELNELDLKTLEKEIELTKEKCKILKNLEMAKKFKKTILNKYEDINEPIILLDIWNNGTNPDSLIVEESNYSGSFNDIDLTLRRSLAEVLSFHRLTK